MSRLEINASGTNIINSANKIIDSDYNDMLSVYSATKASTLNLVSNRSDAGLLGGLLFTTTVGNSDSHRNIAGIVGGRVTTDQTAGGYLGFWTKAGAGDFPRENMRLSHDGKLGIGTIPNTKLHVLGVGGDKDARNIVVSGDLLIEAQPGSRSSTTGAMLEFAIPSNTDGSNVWGQGRIVTVAGNTDSNCACGKMIFGTRRNFDKKGNQTAGWFYGDDLVIDVAGNVGVGSLNPDSKLTVKGIIHAEEVRVDLTVPGPDYVFEKDYNLLPLSEVETYINQNKHLPEVPSAKEMEADGLNLKEMNLILLKKVEELTLHLIEKEKRILTIEKRLEQLEKQ
jgi:hypothetical protein